jgi:hypothetical protein
VGTAQRAPYRECDRRCPRNALAAILGGAFIAVSTVRNPQGVDLNVSDAEANA